MRKLIVLVVSIMLPAGAGLFAQDNRNVEQISTFSHFWIHCHNIFVQGEFAYLATDQGLQIMDVSDPEFPIPRGGFLDLPSQDIFIVGENAFVTRYFYTDDVCILALQIVDISDVDHPVEICQVEIGEDEYRMSAKNLYVSGDYAYVITRQEGLYILSIADVENPRLISTFNTPGIASDIYVQGDIAYIADWEEGLLIIDVSNPENPEEMGNFETAGWAVCVDVKEDYAYISDYWCEDDEYPRSEGFLRVVDLSDLDNPFEVATLETIFRHLKVQGNRLFVHDENFYGGGRIIDISNPEDPEIIGSFAGGGLCFDIAGDFAYTTGEAEFNVINIENPPEPVNMGCYDFWRNRGMAIVGEHSFIVNGMIHAYNISNPVLPRLVGSLDINYAVMARGGNRLVVSRNGISVVNVDDPAEMEIMGSYRIGGGAMDIEATEEYAYVAAGNGGFVIIDLTDPDSLEVVSTHECGQAETVQLSGDFAFVYPYQESIRIFNISDPSRPTEISAINIPSRYFFITDTLALINYSEDMYIFDISDINNPEQISRFDLGYYGYQIFCEGNLAYLIGRDDINGQIDDLHVLDISNLEAPEEVGYYDTPSWGCSGLIVREGLAYCLKYGCVGIYRFINPNVIDTSSPPSPAEFRLDPAYPNPFNSFTTINYNLPQAGNVSLYIYNLSGQRVKTLFNGYRLPGYHSQTLNGGGLASGIYFVRLQSIGQLSTQKVMLLK